jgi:hypothetical protein
LREFPRIECAAAARFGIEKRLLRQARLKHASQMRTFSTFAEAIVFRNSAGKVDGPFPLPVESLRSTIGAK